MHAVSLATATKMPVMENIRLLKLLESSYEQTKNYDQAVQVSKVLVNYVNTELSPSSPEYKIAIDTQTGAMSLCTGTAGQWSCQDMNDSERNLTAEIDRLRAENERLKEMMRRGR